MERWERCFLIILSLLHLATSVTADHRHRDLATLATKWNITSPTFDYASLSFDLNFGVSDYIIEGMPDYSIWDRNCKEGDVSVANNTLVGTIAPIVGDRLSGDGFRTVRLGVAVEPSEVTKDKNVYREATIDGELLAVVEFCVRFGLTTGGDDPIEVNFLETVVTLTIEFTDGFSIANVNVDSRDKISRTANQVYDLEAFQCNYAKSELTSAQKALTRNQGSVIRICVRPDAEAREDGVYMREIIEFTFARDSPAASQLAVVNGEPHTDGLTDLTCNAGDEICVFSTILTAQFYRSTGVVSGSGFASMQFGRSTGASRRLRLGERATQEVEEAGSVASVSEFELWFGTISRVDEKYSGALSSTRSVFAMTFLSSFAGLLFLL